MYFARPKYAEVPDPWTPENSARYQEKLQNNATPSEVDDGKETDQENHPCEPKYHSHTNHHTRNKRIPPARICAARRLPRDVSARSPDRSARCFLDASPPNRSVSAPWQVSAAFVQLEHTGRLAAWPGPLGLHQTVVRQLCRFLWPLSL